MCTKSKTLNTVLGVVGTAAAIYFTGPAGAGWWGGGSAGAGGGSAALGLETFGSSHGLVTVGGAEAARTGVATTVASGMSGWQMAGIGASVLGAAGSVAQSYGAYQGAEAQQQMGYYQAQTAQRQAQMQRYQAEDARLRGRDLARQRLLQARQLKGTQRSVLAAQGRELDNGSALDMLGDTDHLAAWDAQKIDNEAEREAWGHETGAAQSTAQAGLYSQEAASRSPMGSAAGPLLSGAATTAERWQRYRLPGSRKNFWS